MKSLSVRINYALVISIIVFSYFSSCKKTEDPVKFPVGTFPDSTIILSDLNSPYDDFEITNIDLVIDETDTEIHELFGAIPLIITTNRISTGEQSDLTGGILTFSWDQTSGDFELTADIGGDPFLTNLMQAANTAGDDPGAYRRFSSLDGYEYLIVSSENGTGDLDFNYFKNIPVTGTGLPAILGPYPVLLLNSGADDIYLCFDTNMDSAYFSSAIEGNFDIYLKSRPAQTDLTTWFDNSYSQSNKVDSINSTSDEKCPLVYRNVLVFASDRPGGFGGYDLYYSLFKNGKWNSPVNFGPDINTSFNEYRPVIGTHADFDNHFLIFSSDRPEGKGLFDLYFRGVNIP
ncbi:MAG: hypothetical protein JXN62_10770 [Bacteroidales bacterium]|nr:hypothetical protein [Bacteroidales bacterium]